jgi:acyl-coenzyme A synthetase/AMP-(fatty) acid ligase
LTEAAFVMIGSKRWYRTGDLAEMDDKGLFHCLGRLDHQVKILGHRVELEEIDSHVRSVSGLEMVATVAWPIDGFGNAKGTVSFVLGKEIDEDDLLAKLRQRIASYLIPTQIIGLTDMPLNTSGKVDRKALLHRLSNQSL